MTLTHSGGLAFNSATGAPGRQIPKYLSGLEAGHTGRTTVETHAQRPSLLAHGGNVSGAATPAIPDSARCKTGLIHHKAFTKMSRFGGWAEST